MQKIIKVLAIVGVIEAVGIGIGWIVRHRTSANYQPPKPETGPTVETPSSNPPSVPNVVHNVPQTTNSQPGNTVVENPTAILPPNAITNWEDKLDEILGGEM